MKCHLNKKNIPQLEKCDCALTLNGNQYCSQACDPAEHKKLMADNKRVHNSFNRQFNHNK